MMVSGGHRNSRSYFRERMLFKDGSKHISLIQNRFIPASYETQKDVLNQMFVLKKIESAYDRMMQRQEKIARYYNQNLDQAELFAHSHFTTARKEPNQFTTMRVHDLQRSVSKSRDMTN